MLVSTGGAPILFGRRARREMREDRCYDILGCRMSGASGQATSEPDLSDIGESFASK